MKKEIKEGLFIYLRGLAMGAADVVPGVSGGTVAFITGIYEELIHSIKSFNFPNLKLLLSGQVKAFWKAVNANFLLTLFAGIATSVLSLAKVIKLGLEAYPELVWSFFFGLIIASAILVAKEIEKWNWSAVLSLISGTAIAAILTNVSPATTPEAYWFVFLSGALAICAMILPGISGAFILLLLGKYAFVLDAINNRDFTIIAIFGAGAAVGIIAFSNLLSWLLERFRNNTIAVLAGFMIGSLGVVWPWKTPIYKMTAAGNEIFTPSGKPVIKGYIHQLPDTFDMQFFLALGLFIFGIVTIFAVDRLAKRLSKKEKNTFAPEDNF